jgi:hypothetical protein
MWTPVALVSSKIIAKRIKETPVSFVEETKTVIKNRIDEVEKLSVEEMEILIAMIRSLILNNINSLTIFPKQIFGYV